MQDSAPGICARIARGEIAATEVLQACLNRIDHHNLAINAVVTQDRAGAMAAAKCADEAVNAGGPPPSLHGVPISIKDAFETAGLRTTSSHPPLIDHVPVGDATVVARLRAAGGVVVGKTNLSQLAGDPQCWSPLFGPTNNPWNPALTSGGSSGGAAAALAMGFSYLDIGSDIGGSIRIPAAYCGVAGLKATENRIPRTGHIPHLPDAQRSVRHMLSLGVQGKYVSDLRLGLDIIAGPDGLDVEVPPVSSPPVAGDAEKHPLRVAWWDDFAGLPLCSRTRIALAQVIARLQQHGITVERRCPEDFDFAAAWYAYGIIGGAEIGLGMPDVERFVLATAGKFLPRTQPLARSFTSGLSFDWGRYNAALNMRDRLITSLERFLDDWDVWLCPVAPTVAYPHCQLGRYRKPPNVLVDDRPLSYLEATVSMTTPFSLTGSPVVTLPSGIVDGLPVGFQWVGKRWRDEVLLECCAQIERVIGGYVPPPQFE
jgi:amidase